MLSALLPSSSEADERRIYIQRVGNPDKQLSTVWASDASTSGTLVFYSDTATTSGTIELIGQDEFNIGGTPFPYIPSLQEVTDVGATTTNDISINYDGTGNLPALTVVGPPGLFNDFGAVFRASSLATDDAVYYNSTLGGWTFEGNTGDALATYVYPTDATANRFIVWPDASGTVAVSASGNIALSAAGNITFTGTLPIANGGTNASTIGSAGSVPYSTGTAYAFSAVGVSGQILTSGGAGAPTWTTAATTGGANPTAFVDGAPTNGVATTYLRSDGAPALANPFTPSGGTQTIAGSIIVQTDATVDGNYTLGDGGTDTGTLNGDITLGTGSGDTLAIQSATPTIPNVPLDTTTPGVAMDGLVGRANSTNRLRVLDAAASRSFLNLGSAALINVPVTVPNGGTGLTTLTSNGVLVGNGTSNVTVTSAGSSGDLLVAGPAPAFGKTLTGAYTLNNSTASSTGLDVNMTNNNQTAIDIDIDNDVSNTGIRIANSETGIGIDISGTDATAAARFEDSIGASIQADLRSSGTYTFNVTPGEVYRFAGATSIAAGAITRIGGTFSRSATAVGNVGTGEDILHTISVPANMVDGTAQRLRITAVGTYAANANGKTIRVRLNGTGGTSVFSTGSLLANTGDWKLVIEVMRTATTTGEFITTINASNTLVTQALSTDYLSTTVTWSNANTIDITGEATSNNDIVCEWSSAEWLP